MAKKVSQSQNSLPSESHVSSEVLCITEDVSGAVKYDEKKGFLKPSTSADLDPLLSVQKGSLTDKIRQENRERKKRWRQANEDRNKDNDLRCRVNKRAHKLYGKEQSLAKSEWIEAEFLKRQMKRKDRERKRSLESSMTASSSHNMTFSNHNIDNSGFNAVEFSQTFLENLSQNLTLFNDTVPFSLRSALISFSTNSNFLKIITTLFSSLINNVLSPSQTSTTYSSQNTSISPEDTTAQLYQSLSSFFPNDHELSVFSVPEASVHSKNIKETFNQGVSRHISTYSPVTSQMSITASTSVPASSLNYKSYDHVSAMGFPPMPIDFKDEE
ncbi:unnamed protein product [Pneumocystis jirovecii]|uniref:DUF3020 domain-containing protein n=1 Tax=Pneumocystis jirovecii TaxID=42068 RepID=L0PEF2_PNEJI|nr:unnamed protein product [Pneumocystis jirovecii]